MEEFDRIPTAKHLRLTIAFQAFGNVVGSFLQFLPANPFNVETGASTNFLAIERLTFVRTMDFIRRQNIVLGN